MPELLCRHNLFCSFITRRENPFYKVREERRLLPFSSLSLSAATTTAERIVTASTMPAQKRSSSENLEDERRQHNNHRFVEAKQEEEEYEDGEEEGEEVEAEAEEEDGEADGEGDGDGDGEAEEGEGERKDSDGSRSPSEGEVDEFVYVKLSDIRKEVQCPICLGIIRKTRTVMECLHRFCRECIDKSMRMGNNECPACRTHCASRRSLRDDPRYDAIIAALYPDIDKYEEEELAFREEEKTRNKQIQASIAQTFRRQTEALGKRRTTARAVAAFMRRSQGQYRRGRSRRNSRATELQSDDDEDRHGNDGGRDSSSADERSTDVKPKRCKTWGGPRVSQPSSGGTNADDNDELEVSRESASASPMLIGSPDVLVWGRGGVRSHTRYGSVSGNGKNGRGSRITKLVDSLRNSEENDDKLDVHLTIVPLDAQSTPGLEQPYLCCRPTLSVEQLCQFVSLQTSLKSEEVEILVRKERRLSPVSSTNDLILRVDPEKDKLQILEKHETLDALQAYRTYSEGHLVLAYRKTTSC